MSFFFLQHNITRHTPLHWSARRSAQAGRQAGVERKHCASGYQTICYASIRKRDHFIGIYCIALCRCVYLMLTKTPFHNDHQSIPTAKNIYIYNQIPAKWNQQSKRVVGLLSFSPLNSGAQCALHSMPFLRASIHSLTRSPARLLPSLSLGPNLYMEFIKLIYLCCCCCCCLFSFRIVGGITITELNGSVTGLSKYWWC